MQWDGEGLIIGVRRHGETSVIAEVMVAGRGRCLGLVRGGRSPKLSATLQPGNTVQVNWRARLEEHLGTFQLELLEARAAALISDRLRLYASQLVCEHLHLLPERDPHDRLLGMAERIMAQESIPSALGATVARFELGLLEELGFGLDLTSCAATGSTRDLTHVSPKSGRAVSRAAAEPYLSRLLRLPPFLIGDTEPGPGDVADAFKLTSYFLDTHVWMPRQLDQPAVRDTFVGLVS
ncbi:DNA repair protein RecO [Devosia sp. CN2-171]|uniref:DNA repair protein RecO n=1 Tax=Devosia sp. CN2-171 TaxID=3400909 RepID=UPI003BF7F6FB